MFCLKKKKGDTFQNWIKKSAQTYREKPTIWVINTSIGKLVWCFVVLRTSTVEEKMCEFFEGIRQDGHYEVPKFLQSS
jgi:hypothetical protein